MKWICPICRALNYVCEEITCTNCFSSWTEPIDSVVGNLTIAAETVPQIKNPAVKRDRVSMEVPGVGLNLPVPISACKRKL
jgi:hypothetical protein